MKRIVHALCWQRTKKELTIFCQVIAQTYPDAQKIRLVMDNLNTHTSGAFISFFLLMELWALRQRFEFFYTPKSASWLNMIEVEFSAVTSPCLNRRIPTLVELENEALALWLTAITGVSRAAESFLLMIVEKS